LPFFGIGSKIISSLQTYVRNIFWVFLGRGTMSEINIKRLLEEAKILYWNEGEEVIFQQNHIGIHNNLENKKSETKTPILQCNKE
jgi:hypothetical protein